MSHILSCNKENCYFSNSMNKNIEESNFINKGNEIINHIIINNNKNDLNKK